MFLTQSQFNTMKKLFFTFIIFYSFTAIAQVDDKSTAMSLISKNQKNIGLSSSDMNNFIISDAYLDNTSKLFMVYLQQSLFGLPVYNQLKVLAFRNGELVSSTGSRINSIEKLTLGNNGIPSISAETAVLSAMKDRNLITTHLPVAKASEKNGHLIVFDDMGICSQDITAELMWVPIANGKKIVLAWQVYLVPLKTNDYWMVRVNALENTIVSVNNFTAYCNWSDPCIENHSTENKNKVNCHEASINPDFLFDFNLNRQTGNQSTRPTIVNNAKYRVVPYPYESPIHFTGTTDTVRNPWSAASGNASSLKWHNNGTTDFISTRGNNVWAKEDRAGTNGTGLSASSTTSSDPLNFDFIPNFTITPTQTSPVPNQQFNTTNLFYWVNISHDLSYLYGFDEVSGNFQASNQGRGGLGNDYVLADAQDGGGTNNANFSTPPDGSSGRMQMYLWNGTPQKDGDVDNGVIVHEFAHGISNRLTGGPSQAGCLSNAEEMGEGWSDYFALMYTQNWATATTSTGYNSPRAIGTYVLGQATTGAGIRSKKYCTNFAVNNKIYASTIDAETHNRGEIWCATLWDMTWNIINQLGTINPNLYNTNNLGGNTIALNLVMEGMKLQPCSPGFIDGRDAILQADQLLYNGAYSCAIREAFRRRGMGAFASQGSSGSVTDQIADTTAGGALLQLSQTVREAAELTNITYTNKITASNCGGVNNFILTDTLPINVTYINGGSYNSSNRVVSFPVSVAAGQTQLYSFTVQVNDGSYFPTVSLFEDNVNGSNIPTIWTETSTTTTHWLVSSTRSSSPQFSYFSENIDTISDQRLTLTNAINLGATPPPLSFKHWFNTEGTYDGGVLEISTNGGNTWSDMQSNILTGGYVTQMDASTLLAGRMAWSGGSNNKFIKTKVNLTPYANQNVKFRFRFCSDLGTNVEGWNIDDIAIKNQALVEMQSNIFNNSGIKVLSSDTFTIILPKVICTPSVVSLPAVSACSSYFWNGLNYTSSGMKTWIGTNIGGCDSVVTLQLTINQQSSSTTTATICQGQTYSFNGNQYTTSGNYNVRLTNTAGCDSTANLVLTVIAATVSAPSFIVGSSNINQCDTLQTFSVNRVVGLTYNWSVTGTGNRIINSQGNSSVIIVMKSAGIVSVTAANSCGNVSTATKLSVIKSMPATPGTIYQKITPTLVAANTNACLFNQAAFLTTGRADTFMIRSVANVTGYYWKVPSGSAFQQINDTTIAVVFSNTLTLPNTIKVFSISACDTSLARTLTLAKTTPVTPGSIYKSFNANSTTGTAPVTSVCHLVGGSSETYMVRKVATATSYNWSLSFGTNAVITHLNPAGENDTAIIVTYNLGYTRDTIKVASLNGCGVSIARTLSTSAILATPSVTSIAGSTTPCIGNVITYTATATAPTASQSSISIFRWTKPNFTSIINATSDSASITIQYNSGFTGGSISAKGQSACGIAGSAKSISLQYLTPTPTSITSSTGSYNACIGATVNFTAVIPAPTTTQRAAAIYRWTKPNNTSILSANSDSSSITLQFNTGFTGGVITVKGQTLCGVLGTAKSQTLTHVTCPAGTKILPITSNDINNDLDVMIFPNPSTNYFNVKLTSNAHELRGLVNIYDLQGRILQAVENNPLCIKKFGEGLNAGVYLVEVIQGKQKKSLRWVKI